MRAREIEVHFEPNRINRRDLLARRLLILSFTIVSFVLLIFIPYVSNQNEIIGLENSNNSISNQLSLIQNEHNDNDMLSVTEIEYSNTYSYLITHKQKVDQYIADIIGVASSYVDVSTFVMDASENRITITFLNATETQINEFLVTSYETYGIVNSGDGSNRWITDAPTRRNITITKVEVTFYYA